MKIKIADLSILHRVYLSFAVLIGVLIAGSMLNYSSQNQLNSALVSVTEEAAPIVLLANKLEVSLLSTNKRLTDVLSEKDPQQLLELTKELETSRKLFTQSLDNFKQQADKLPLVKTYIPTLEKASKSYLGETADLAAQRTQLLTLLRQTNKAKSEFQ
ncbi:MAG: MCP four helix bundle domain-containing protein, partial [Aeromonadaceae bacterium]|nr:MCP four helix bundle domain-containing protein [Aeromonadaceae bacterium]